MSLIFLASLLRMMMTLGSRVLGTARAGCCGEGKVPHHPSSCEHTEDPGGGRDPTRPFSLQPHPGAILYRELLKGLVLFVFGLSLEVGMDKKHMER